MDLYFMCSTPPRRFLWFRHDARSLMGRYLSGLRATLLIKVSCRVTICFLMLGISNNFFLTFSFVMCCYFTSSILMPGICLLLQCRNTSNVLGGICGAPSYHITIVINLWEWR